MPATTVAWRPVCFPATGYGNRHTVNLLGLLTTGFASRMVGRR